MKNKCIPPLVDNDRAMHICVLKDQSKFNYQVTIICSVFKLHDNAYWQNPDHLANGEFLNLIIRLFF